MSPAVAIPALASEAEVAAYRALDRALVSVREEAQQMLGRRGRRATREECEVMAEELLARLAERSLLPRDVRLCRAAAWLTLAAAGGP